MLTPGVSPGGVTVIPPPILAPVVWSHSLGAGIPGSRALVAPYTGRVDSTGAYLDHAATTPMRPEAVAAMEPFLHGTFGNPSGGHAVARAAKTALEEAREEVAELLGARPAEVVFTAGGTEADNLAVKGVARAARAAGGGDLVVTAAFEHKGVLAASIASDAMGSARGSWRRPRTVWSTSTPCSTRSTSGPRSCP